jgi:hypothetical protein
VSGKALQRKSNAGTTGGILGTTKEILELIFTGKYKDGNEIAKEFTVLDSASDGTLETMQLEDLQIEEILLVSPNLTVEEKDSKPNCIPKTVTK